MSAPKKYPVGSDAPMLKKPKVTRGACPCCGKQGPHLDGVCYTCLADGCTMCRQRLTMERGRWL